MHTYVTTPPNWENELNQLSPEARAYVERLQQDSEQLRQTFDFGLFRPAELSGLISKTFTAYMATELVRCHTDAENYVDGLCLLHQNMVDTVGYLETKP